MTFGNEQYLVDAEGNRVGVLLDLATYERLLDAAEELADIQAYTAAKATLANEELITVEQAIAEYEEQQVAVQQQPT